jgi:hypothetical protein
MHRSKLRGRDADGSDVSGRTIAAAFHIPGNVLKGGFRAAIYI